MLNHIKSTSFMGWAAIFTVLFLTPNTYYVYHSFSVFESPYREIASIGVALIIAASILIYTLRKNFKVAKYYTIFEVSISAYYYINTIGWDWGLIPALGFTLILPISVYYYSREFDKDTNDLEFYKKEHLRNKYLSVHIEAERVYKEQAQKKCSELQQECAHWVSEYERAMTGWTNDVGMRDERIQELEYQLEYNNKILNSREETIKSMRFQSEYLRNELKKYQDPFENPTDLGIDILKKQPNGRLLDYPEVVKPEKPQAPKNSSKKANPKNSE